MRHVASFEERPAPTPIRVAGRLLHPTPVFDTYWRFAARRHAVYQARLEGRPGPWTDDPILLRHRFTNCYRAADRVSQFLIRHVSYTGVQDVPEVVFRTLLFKMFNRVSTWELLSGEFGELSWKDFDRSAYDDVLTRAFDSGRKLYSAAYVIPPPRLGADRKHSNHLRLLELMMTTDVGGRIARGGSLRAAFEVLMSYPAMGDFLAYQFAIDLNYSAVFDFDEMEFVVAGPGARDGIRKCFGPSSDGIEADVIRYMADHQQEHFARLDLSFTGLAARPLQLIDCQNLFCEVDKYARVAHPEVAGHSGRSRIKQLFQPVPEPVGAWFPPKWNLSG
ncbi:nucleotide kinase domain-containing protein [Streptomyces sp. NPDC004237]|uniref:nucleotide kinase domain-containing protein n=1 Tax=Streptomyces sp. NPDC004237 TaxID=3154455 RepID=UPI00339DE2DD